MNERKTAELRLSLSEWWSKKRELFGWIFLVVRIAVFAFEKANRIQALIARVLDIFH